MNKKIVSFGEIMLRLSPDNGDVSTTDSFSACFGGTEANVLVLLSALGNKTGYLTAVPKNSLGDGVLKFLRARDVDTEDIIQKGDVLGMYFMEQGFGMRASNVIYNRRYSEVTRLSEDDFNYDDIFNDCGIFHISGISFSLSESTQKLCIRLLKEAKKRNIKVSFDFNYRSKLWTVEAAKTVYSKIVDYVDILFCSERDLNSFLDTDAEGFYKKYNSEYVVVREREICSETQHCARATIYKKSGNDIKSYAFKGIEFPVLDRIGAGDAFAAGIIHKLIKNPDDIKDALDFGMAAFALKHSYRGDTLTANEEEICDCLNNFLKDVDR